MTEWKWTQVVKHDSLTEGPVWDGEGVWWARMTCIWPEVHLREGT